MRKLDEQLNSNSSTTWTTYNREVMGWFEDEAQLLLEDVQKIMGWSDAIDDALSSGWRKLKGWAAGDGDSPSAAELLATGPGGAGQQAALDAVHGRVSGGDRDAGHRGRTYTGRALGGPLAAGQLAIVGEHGPELVRFPMPAVVTSAERSAQMLAGMGEPRAVNVTEPDSGAWSYGPDTPLQLIVDGRKLTQVTLGQLAKRKSTG